jgi:ATP-binding cassette, subfamily B, bacterial
MTTFSTPEAKLSPTMPGDWSVALTALLEPGEQVLAWLEPDLDEHLFFASGALVLSSHRIFSRAPGTTDWLVWNVSTTLSLQHRDHAGVGAIELFDGTTRLGIWRHTLGIVPAVARMIELFGHSAKKVA